MVGAIGSYPGSVPYYPKFRRAYAVLQGVDKTLCCNIYARSCNRQPSGGLQTLRWHRRPAQSYQLPDICAGHKVMLGRLAAIKSRPASVHAGVAGPCTGSPNPLNLDLGSRLPGAPHGIHCEPFALELFRLLSTGSPMVLR